MTTNEPIERRCADGRACVEVVERVKAADLAKYVARQPEQADQLRATARWWAEQHRYGAPPPEETA